MPALSLAVARPGAVVWAEALGKADLELDVPAATAHRFKLGSISKVLTATVAAKLVSRGAVDLDAPIANWLSDLPEVHRRTTTKQLLTHQGGIRHYIARDADPAAPGGSIEFREYPNNQAILDIFIRDPLVGPPGAQVFYSTFGYTLASLVLEAAAKRPFAELVKSEIGAAFGLSSLDVDAYLDLCPMRVHGYNDAAARALTSFKALVPGTPNTLTNARLTNPAYKLAGGGFVMTPSDIALFGAAMIDAPSAKITAAERALLFTPIARNTNPPLGLGWRVDADAKGRARWHHAGSQEGGRAGLVVYPELRLSIAFASNVMTVPADVLRPSSDLADAFA